MASIGRIYGHKVELGRRTADGIEIRLVRTRWAPFALSWAVSGMVSPWYVRPVVFCWALWSLARSTS